MAGWGGGREDERQIEREEREKGKKEKKKKGQTEIIQNREKMGV